MEGVCAWLVCVCALVVGADGSPDSGDHAHLDHQHTHMVSRSNAASGKKHPRCLCVCLFMCVCVCSYVCSLSPLKFDSFIFFYDFFLEYIEKNIGGGVRIQIFKVTNESKTWDCL